MAAGDRFLRIRNGFAFFNKWRLRSKLLYTIIPVVVIILFFTEYVSIKIANRFLDEAIGRVVILQTLSLSHEIETFLDNARSDLLLISQGKIDRDNLATFLTLRIKVKGHLPYKELAYISLASKDESLYYVVANDVISTVSNNEIQFIQPNPLLLFDNISGLKAGEVWISDAVSVNLPVSTGDFHNRFVSAPVIRLLTPCFDANNVLKGFLILSISLEEIKKTLSIYNSQQSPIYAFLRSPVVRYYFYIDMDGWMLFESDEAIENSKGFSTELARSDFSGIVGKPGFPNAFRPLPANEYYWEMVRDIRAGNHKLVRVKGGGDKSDNYFMGYAPLRFETTKTKPKKVIAGIVFLDRSKFSAIADFRLIDIVLTFTVISIFTVSIIIIYISHVFMRSIFDLSHHVMDINKSKQIHSIDIPDTDYETSVLKSAINKLLETIRNQVAEIKLKELAINHERQKARLSLDLDIGAGMSGNVLDDIIGSSSLMNELKAAILKVAANEQDVLIYGETGTGKQLAAEAVHANGKRAQMPFITINCGALDENLLLDTLFGHIKGAFTEAKAERKGAFISAHNGTLFLDEIEAASPNVQQSLLRALSIRKSTPLGSDRELDFDVRLIAATNIDLKKLVESGGFREDLYYRLHVLEINTPALREHMDDIPELVKYFLKQLSTSEGRPNLSITKGAMDKLTGYDWPGNIRELRNCLTRAVIMKDGDLIDGSDLIIDNYETGVSRSEETVTGERFEQSLNPRQLKAMPYIEGKGEISRIIYQEIVGNNLPSRTAIADLHDLVEKGILVKRDRGRSTRYYLAKLRNDAR